VKFLALSRCQLAGPAASMPLFDALNAMLDPGTDPVVNAAAMNPQQIGNGRRGVAVGAQQDGLQAQGHARRFVGMGFLPQGKEVAAGPSVSVNE